MIDGDLRTLHVRCGSDIRDTLKSAGFGGDFLEYSDPVCEGPVPDTADLPAVRARYLAASFGERLGFTEADCLARLCAAERQLADAHRYERVVLWFEHDNHDQLILARILTRFRETAIPARLELICIGTHPSVPRFNGLGQLDAAALAGLWPSRTAVTADQMFHADLVWFSLRQPGPIGLLSLAAQNIPQLPFMAPAIRRHLAELPGFRDGLSMTQRIVLTILAEQPRPIGRAFEAMVNGREPLVFMGDIGVLGTAERLADSGVLAIEPGDEPFTRMARVTELGHKVLEGKTDYLALRPAERWVGGVICNGLWRWDPVAETVILKI
jgi:hypothetical protein